MEVPADVVPVGAAPVVLAGAVPVARVDAVLVVPADAAGVVRVARGVTAASSRTCRRT